MQGIYRDCIGGVSGSGFNSVTRPNNGEPCEKGNVENDMETVTIVVPRI